MNRYSKRIIKSQSVSSQKAWSAREPHRRGYEAETSKTLVCVNSKLSLPNGGEWIDVCYLPEGAFSSNPSEREATFLNEMEIFTLLAEIGGMIGTPVVDVEIWKKNSPDKGLYNTYAQGKADLSNIVERFNRALTL